MLASLLGILGGYVLGCGAPAPLPTQTDATRACPEGQLCEKKALRTRAKVAQRSLDAPTQAQAQPQPQPMPAKVAPSAPVEMPTDTVAPEPVAPPPPEVDKVAVMPVRDAGQVVSWQKRRDLTKRLWPIGGQTVRGSTLVSMDEKNMSQFTGRDKTLGECVSDDAIESGRNLKAKYIVTTEVVKVQNGLRLDVYGHLTSSGQSLEQLTEVVPNESKLGQALDKNGTQVLERILAHHQGASDAMPSEEDVVGEDEVAIKRRHKKERGRVGYVDIVETGLRVTKNVVRQGYKVTKQVTGRVWNSLFGGGKEKRKKKRAVAKDTSGSTSSFSQQLYELGQERVRSKDDVAAAMFFRQAYELDNGHSASLCWLAKTYRRLGRHNDALKRAGRCVSQATQQKKANLAAMGAYTRGRVFEARGQYGAATKAYGNAVRWRATGVYRSALRRVSNR